MNKCESGILSAMPAQMLKTDVYKTSLRQRLINRAYHKRFEFKAYDKSGVFVKTFSRRERAVMFCDINDGHTFLRVQK